MKTPKGAIQMALAIVIILIIAAGAGGYVWYASTSGEDTNANTTTVTTNVNTSSTIPIDDIFVDKVVYGYGLNADLLPALKQDCQDRGGQFHTCGSPCATNSEICITVCAYTCELDAHADDTSQTANAEQNDDISLCDKEDNCCVNDDDCKYIWYTGGCNTPEYVAKKQKEAQEQGMFIGEAPPRENVTCTCENNKCITHN